MIDPHVDPRTEDTLAYELVSTRRDQADPTVVGLATFRGGETRIEAPDAVRLAVEELMGRAFVDRVQADERPRGYRRSRQGMVDMLVPGMPEHFIARMRGLWLSYPDGSVVTARPALRASLPAATVPDATDVGPPVTDARVRRASLVAADQTLGTRPLVMSHPPDSGLRPVSAGKGPVARSDCGWLV
jgi:hypothetical protein